MREAFRGALEGATPTLLTDEIRDSLEGFRAEQEFARLGRRILWLGKSWLNLRIHRASSQEPIEELRNEWLMLLKKVAARPAEERIEIMEKFAESLGPFGENLDASNLMPAKKINILSRMKRAIFSGMKFSPASQIFISAFCDLSNFSLEDRVDFETFLFKATRSKGTIMLPQLINGVNSWLDKRFNLKPETS